MEVLLHGGSTLHGWTSATIHRLVVETYGLQNYSLTQLRCDLRKMKAHGLIARHGRHYTYFLTDKGAKVSALLLLIHKRLCGPLANSLFQQKPAQSAAPPTPLEAAYHKADKAFEPIVELLAA